MVREYAELGSPKVAAEAVESPNGAAGLQGKLSPMPFRVERSSTDIRDGFYGAVRLLLLESGAKPVFESVAVHVKRARAVGDSVPIGDNQDPRGRELCQDFSHQLLRGGRKCNLNPQPPSGETS